jgi:hypothetical protein
VTPKRKPWKEQGEPLAPGEFASIFIVHITDFVQEHPAYPSLVVAAVASAVILLLEKPRV